MRYTARLLCISSPTLRTASILFPPRWLVYKLRDRLIERGTAPDGSRLRYSAILNTTVTAGHSVRLRAAGEEENKAAPNLQHGQPGW